MSQLVQRFKLCDRVGPAAVRLAVAVVLIWLGSLAAPAVASAGNAGADAVYYQSGTARPLIRSSREFMLRVAMDRRSEFEAAIGQIAEVQLETHLPLGPDRCCVRVRSGSDAGEAELRATPGVLDVRPAYRVAAHGPCLYETGEIVVAIDTGLPASARSDLMMAHGLQLVRAVAGLRDTLVYRPADPGRDSVSLAATLQHTPGVRHAHPDFLASIDTNDVMDPLFADQWHLQNTGQGGGARGADIHALQAWSVTEGLEAVIAVLDGGHEIDHPDLLEALVAAHDYADGDDDPAGSPHGTSVSGLAIGRANSIGIRGVAPLAGWVAMRLGSDSGVAESFAFADAHGAVVHSNSWKYMDPSYLPTVVHEAIVNAVTHGRGGKGMIVVFSAGNDARPIRTQSALAVLEETIAVGASTDFDQRAAYSNLGAELDLLAPSDGGSSAITTTYPEGLYTPNFGGTSAAAPQVSGVVALILSVNPDLTAGQVRRIIEHTCQVIDASISPAPAVTGHSSWHGYGRLDAAAAVQAALASLANGTSTWPVPVEQLVALDGPAAIDLSWTNPPEDFASVVVVESRFPIDWSPTDGVAYSVGQVVAPGTTVRYTGNSTSFTHAAAPGLHHYAAFAHNAVHQYSWGVATTGVRGGMTVLAEGFEALALGWTHFGPQDSWTVGSPSYFAGPPSAGEGNKVCGTNLTGDYANGGGPDPTPIATLRSPPLLLVGGNAAFLTFRDWLSVEGGPHDHVRLDVVSLSGEVLATQIDGYQDNHHDWRRLGVDLSAFAGTTVRVDFTLLADDQITAPGWYIDDVLAVVADVSELTGDADGDGDVDLADYALLHVCLTAPGAAANAEACMQLDSDADADVDLSDAAVVLAAFGQ